mgnify:CR=1 FL=1
MERDILFRLVVNGRVICEKYSLDEVRKVKDSLSDEDKSKANIIPITEAGAQFLLS